MRRNKDPRSRRQISDFLNDTNANTAESTLKTNKCFECGLWWGNIYDVSTFPVPSFHHIPSEVFTLSASCHPPSHPWGLSPGQPHGADLGIGWWGMQLNRKEMGKDPHQGKWANISHPYFNFQPAFMLNVSLVKLSVNFFILSAFQFSLWPVYH